jgi:hypothetical protein
LLVRLENGNVLPWNTELITWMVIILLRLVWYYDPSPMRGVPAKTLWYLSKVGWRAGLKWSINWVIILGGLVPYLDLELSYDWSYPFYWLIPSSLSSVQLCKKPYLDEDLSVGPCSSLWPFGGYSLNLTMIW